MGWLPCCGYPKDVEKPSVRSNSKIQQQPKQPQAPQEPQQNYGKDAYTLVGQLGTGRNGTMKLMRNKKTKELVAAKWVPRTVGGGLSKNTEREIVNHRKLLHPNIICFKEVSSPACCKIVLPTAVHAPFKHLPAR